MDSNPNNADARATDGHQNEVLKAIAERRSLRQYRDEPVSREILDELTVMTRWAPSNWNSQPWRLYYFDKKSDIESICSVMDARAAEALESSSDKHFRHFVEHCSSYFYVLRQSPVVVAMFYKPFAPRMEASVSEYFGDETGGAGWNPNLISFGMAAQNLLLAAHSMGLAGCFHSGPVPFLDGRIHEMLGLHPKLVLGGLVTLGWPVPEEDPASGAKRKKMSFFLHYADERMREER